MIEKPIDKIDGKTLSLLIQDQVREDKTIEYKRELPGRSDSEAKEFLADITSFANASGGDILYGVATVDGVPSEISGISGDLDAEVLRLEGIIRTGVEPRIPSIQIRVIGVDSKGSIILIRVARSWLGPHMVKHSNLSRFYMRGGAGKFQMDVGELRSAFLANNSVSQNIRIFRRERISGIIAGDIPVPISGAGYLVLHVIPGLSFGTEYAVDLSLVNNQIYFPPFSSSGYDRRFNSDGIISFARNTYCQLYRNGCVETVGTNIIYKDDDGKLRLRPIYEKIVLEKTVLYLRALRGLKIECPISIGFSLLGVKGAKLAMNDFFDDVGAIDKNELILPEIVLDAYGVEDDIQGLAQLLRPAFDVVWNASGAERSCNFDDNGNWIGK